MKTVEWTDKDGYNHKALLRDNDPDEMAWNGYGISADPPDIEGIDWSAVKRDLHNLLLLHGITGFDSIRQGNQFFGSVLTKCLKRNVITWLKEYSK